MASVSSNQFSIDLLQRPAQFQRFMSGERDLDAIAEMAKHPEKIVVPSKDNLYFSRWSIVWFVCTVPFKVILILFSKAVARISSFLGCTRVSRYFAHLDKQMMKGGDHFQKTFNSQKIWKEKFLAPAENIKQPISWDAPNLEPIPIIQINPECLRNTGFPIPTNPLLFDINLKKGKKSHPYELAAYFLPFRWFMPKPTFLSKSERLNIKSKLDKLIFEQKKEEAVDLVMKLQQDYPRWELHLDSSKPEVQKLVSVVIAELQREIDFNCDGGVCAGASHWFIHLFLQSYDLFEDKEKLLISVAKQFEYGVPSQGTVLQAFNKEWIFYKGNDRIKAPYKLREELKKAKPLFENSTPGIYDMTIYKHGLVYINLGGQRNHFIFDPNYGLFKLSPSEIVKFVSDHYKKADWVFLSPKKYFQENDAQTA